MNSMSIAVLYGNSRCRGGVLLHVNCEEEEEEGVIKG